MKINTQVFLYIAVAFTQRWIFTRAGRRCVLYIYSYDVLVWGLQLFPHTDTHFKRCVCVCVCANVERNVLFLILPSVCVVGAVHHSPSKACGDARAVEMRLRPWRPGVSVIRLRKTSGRFRRGLHGRVPSALGLVLGQNFAQQMTGTPSVLKIMPVVGS